VASIARYVIGWHRAQCTQVQHLVDDLASNACFVILAGLALHSIFVCLTHILDDVASTGTLCGG